MATAQDIINRAFSLARIKQEGHTLTSSESSDALEIMNDILEEWSIEKLLSYQKKEETHTLVASTNNYTIGSSGTINTTRPTRILSAFVRDSNNRDFPIAIVNKVRYDLVPNKTLTSIYPELLFYDPGYTLGTIYLYPTPNTANTLHFVTQSQFTSIATLTTEVSVPVGYKKALIYNLALELSEEWSGQPTQFVFSKAEKLLSKLKVVNNEYEQEFTCYDPIFRRNNYNDIRRYTI